MRIVSATSVRGPRGPSAASASAEREREADPGPGRPSGRSHDDQSAAVGLDEPPADEQAEARARDARLADVPGAMERLRDQDRVPPPGTPTPSSSTVTASHAPSTSAPMTIGLPSGAYLRALPTRFDRTWPTRATSTSTRRQVDRAVDDQPFRAAGDRELAAQPRDEGIERRRRSLEDQRIGLQVGHVEDLVDERRQPAARLVDALDVGPLLRRASRSRWRSVSA